MAPRKEQTEQKLDKAIESHVDTFVGSLGIADAKGGAKGAIRTALLNATNPRTGQKIPFDKKGKVDKDQYVVQLRAAFEGELDKASNITAGEKYGILKQFDTSFGKNSKAITDLLRRARVIRSSLLRDAKEFLKNLESKRATLEKEEKTKAEALAARAEAIAIGVDVSSLAGQDAITILTKIAEKAVEKIKEVVKEATEK